MVDIVTYYGYTRKLNDTFQNYICKLYMCKIMLH